MAKLDYSTMTDEELMNAPPPEPEAVTEEVVTPPTEEPAPTEEEEVPVVEDNTEPNSEEEAKGEVEGAGTAPETEAKKPEASTTEETKPTEETKKTDPVLDYKAEYERLLTPFKANGREIQVKSVDDAISLMQMGANYNKKMAALKPNLKLMKMLENNNLLTEDKISFLIDLEKKNPNAINKLVSDSGMDPMDLNAEKASAYKQSTYSVDDREIELDTVLDDLKGSDAYNRTLEIVSTKWDSASKQAIAANPDILRVINDHVSSGIYDMVHKEVESERLFGRLTGLSDIDAYRKVGDALHAKGAFNSLAKGSSPSQEKPAQPVVVATTAKKADDGKLNDKRRAASSTKPVVSAAANKDFNPLALSDEEFDKLFAKQFH